MKHPGRSNSTLADREGNRDASRGLDEADLFTTLVARLPNPDPRSARTYWVGYSGGADSQALLELAVARYGAACVRATHVDHGLQDASGAWAAQCRRRAAALGVGFDLLRLTAPTKGATEAWGRAQRYRYWGKLLQPDDCLLLAHHGDDQIETVALRLLQGRLPRLMPARRELGQGHVLRPLLGVQRAQLRAFLAGSNSAWIEDPTNTDPRHLRNWVRGALLPELHAQAPQWSSRLSRCGELTERLLKGFESRLTRCGWTAQKAAGVLIELPIHGLGQQGLLGLLQQCGVTGVSGRQTRQALQQLKSRASQPMRVVDHRGRQVELWSARVARQPGLVVWRVPPAPTRQPLLLTSHDALWQLGHGHLRIAAKAAARARAETDHQREFWLRFAKPGDTIAESGGRSCRLADVFRDAAVPRWARSSYPILVDGEGVLCVPGLKRRKDCQIRASWHPAD